jgi:hypothetical protein
VQLIKTYPEQRKRVYRKKGENYEQEEQKKKFKFNLFPLFPVTRSFKKQEQSFNSFSRFKSRFVFRVLVFGVIGF